MSKKQNKANLQIKRPTSAFRLRRWLYGVKKICYKKEKLFEIFTKEIHIKIYTNGIIEGLPEDWQNVFATNYFPTIILQKLALIPNELLSKTFISAKETDSAK